MKVAFVSYEYPPDTGIGGIATYVYQVSNLLNKRGHYVEVFCASYERHDSGDEGNGFLVHRIKCHDKYAFKAQILDKFSERHGIVRFDIFESPEYSADGLFIKQKYPNLPLVVKLHTPDFLVKEISHIKPKRPTFFQNFKHSLFSYLQFRQPNPNWWKYNYQTDPEYQLTNLAELISSPSHSLADIVERRWKIDKKRITHLPYPYTPLDEFLSIPVESKCNIVSFFGRLEVRKGVAIFSEVIPAVLQVFPQVKFRFIGRDQPSLIKDVTMKNFLLEKLEGFKDKLEFVDHIPGPYIFKYFAESDICVFPSVWENFPNVCLEAMSAGRAIIASREGGMYDMLNYPKAGELINPLSADEISGAIIKLLKDDDYRWDLGYKARNSVLTRYNGNSIGKQIDEQYSSIVHKFI